MLAIYFAGGALLMGAILRIVGNYLGLVWGLIAAAIFSGIYLIYLYKLVLHFFENSRRD
jgi:hypothetical protein